MKHSKNGPPAFLRRLFFSVQSDVVCSCPSMQMKVSLEKNKKISCQQLECLRGPFSAVPSRKNCLRKHGRPAYP